VSRAFQEMEENGSIKKIPEIRDICKDDFKIVKLTQKETIRRLTDPEKETFSDIIRA
jgi:DNA-binding transcriptional regulator YhcF (GntR family)